MGGAAAPSPPPMNDAVQTWLTPRSWRLEGDPPLHDLLTTVAGGREPPPPLLLLLDRRAPLPPPVSMGLEASLTAPERQRHGAYRRPADRERFLLGRAGLRRLLGHWLGLPPQAVPLASGPHGKPHCPGGPSFNVSHAGDLILLALHPSQPVGVDVERLRPGLDWWAIARRVLPAAELEALAARPTVQRPEAFLAAWCRLEARLKARGDGLAGLEQLRREQAIPITARGPCDSAAPRRDRDEPAATPARPETIWNVAVPHGYRAAAALACGRR